MSFLSIANVCLPNVLEHLPKRHLFNLFFVSKQFKDLYSSSVMISTLRNIIKQNTHFNTFDSSSFPLERLMKMTKFSTPRELAIKPYLYNYLDSIGDDLKIEVIHGLDVKEIQSFTFYKQKGIYNVPSNHYLVITFDGKLFMVDKLDTMMWNVNLKRKEMISPFAINQICVFDTMILILSESGEVYRFKLNLPQYFEEDLDTFVEKSELIENIPSIKSLCRGPHYTLLLDVNGRVWMLPAGRDSNLQFINSLENVVKLDADGTQILALTNNGKVYCTEIDYKSFCTSTPKLIQTNSFIVDLFCVKLQYQKVKHFILVDEHQCVNKFMFSDNNYIQPLIGKPTCLLVFSNDVSVLFEAKDVEEDVCCENISNEEVWYVDDRELKLIHNHYDCLSELFDYENYWLNNVGPQREWTKDKKKEYYENLREVQESLADEYMEKQYRKSRF